MKIWVEPVIVFSNPNVNLETVSPEVERVVKLEKLAESITSYNGYSFSVEQLKAIGNAIIKKAQSI